MSRSCPFTWCFLDPSTQTSTRVTVVPLFVPATMWTGEVTVAPLTGSQMVTDGCVALSVQGVCAKAWPLRNIRAARKAKQRAYERKQEESVRAANIEPKPQFV